MLISCHSFGAFQQGEEKKCPENNVWYILKYGPFWSAVVITALRDFLRGNESDKSRMIGKI